MQISVLGRTDKRPCIYTLMKMLQPMGDVILITNNRMYARLLEDDDRFGYYQNITVFITDDTADEIWLHDELDREDYEHVILDNLYNEDTDVILYVQGAGVEAADEDLLETFGDNMTTIYMGKGKGRTVVPYSKDLMEKLEKIEYFKILVPPSPQMAKVLAHVLAAPLGMSVGNLMKVVTKK